MGFGISTSMGFRAVEGRHGVAGVHANVSHQLHVFSLPLAGYIT
jgi:hypothetical protein